MDDYDLMADLKEWAESYDAIEIGADGVFHNAIDRIETLEAEMKLVMEINERLLAALRKICDGPRDADKSYPELFAEVCWEARAALGMEEKDEQSQN